MFVDNTTTIDDSYNDKNSIFNHSLNLKFTENYHDFYDNEIYLNFVSYHINLFFIDYFILDHVLFKILRYEIVI